MCVFIIKYSYFSWSWSSPFLLNFSYFIINKILVFCSVWFIDIMLEKKLNESNWGYGSCPYNSISNTFCIIRKQSWINHFHIYIAESQFPPITTRSSEKADISGNDCSFFIFLQSKKLYSREANWSCIFYNSDFNQDNIHTRKLAPSLLEWIVLWSHRSQRQNDRHRRSHHLTHSC